MKAGQRFGRRLVIWQVVPGQWADNRESPVGLDRRHRQMVALQG